MSVIAKLQVRGVTDFGMGKLIELSCVCENDLMAAYAKAEEDRLFTKYSPWGEMKVSQPEGWALTPFAWTAGDPLAPPPSFYVMALHADEHDHVEGQIAWHTPDVNFPGCSAWAYGTCYSVTDFGGTRHVEFRANSGGKITGRAIERLNWKMSVDNPGASNQFKPGDGYYFVLYDASKFDMHQAIRAAHGHPAPEAAA
jgi:hypothetical protein